MVIEKSFYFFVSLPTVHPLKTTKTRNQQAEITSKKQQKQEGEKSSECLTFMSSIFLFNIPTSLSQQSHFDTRYTHHCRSPKAVTNIVFFRFSKLQGIALSERFSKKPHTHRIINLAVLSQDRVAQLFGCPVWQFCHRTG